MIVGIGTDLVHIPRFRNLISKHGDKIINRLFHISEINNKPLMEEKQAQYFASRWAVKEATLKALGKGGLGSKCIYVTKTNGNPSPILCLEGASLERLKEIANVQDDTSIRKYVSISHDKDYAVATVLLENVKN
ncbi:holo-[acyl-carrier protein] synthase [Acrasis kona]|uniref:Holo-[acyl-carrier protein] synthase n=1 Tax=Acrasis kona TaxID=1008807 RepID=A0AAW2ZMU4_9EUKA